MSERFTKSKAPLVLMEQLIMILVFAITAAVCIQGFVHSVSLSRQSSLQWKAVTHQQEVVEVIKANQGNLQQAAEQLEGTVTDNGLERFYLEDDMKVVVELLPTEEYLQKANVTVYNRNKQIKEMEAAWQVEK